MTDDRESSEETESAPLDNAGRTTGSGPPASGATSWVGIIANRNSGAGRGRRLVDQLVSELRRLGIASEVAWSPQARASLVERASVRNHCRCLIAVGGDGTVSALLNEHPGVPMTVMPAGTENLVARHFGLRRDPHGLARLISAGRAVPVDLAEVAGRRFLLMAGFGFDADVVTRHHRGRISRSGAMGTTSRLAYVWPILRASFTYRFPVITVRILDPGCEETLRGTTVFLFNLPRYALGLPFVPIARDDDGWLDLVVFRHPGPFRAFYYLCKVFLGVHLTDPSVYHRRVRKVVVTSRSRIPVQLDGDPAGSVLPRRRGEPMVVSQGVEDGGTSLHRKEWVVEILPSSLSMLVPPRHLKS